MANFVKKAPIYPRYPSKSLPNARPSSLFSPFYRGLMWGILLSGTAAISAAIGAAVTLFSPLSASLVPVIQQAEISWKKSSSLPGIPYNLSRPVNILVLGVDRVLDAPRGSLEAFGGRSDTILLLRFDPDGDRAVRLLSIPRDSRVLLPQKGYHKINDANVLGGPTLAARVVSQTLNDVPIDRYLRVTTDAFKDLVDWVGGVEVYVPYPMTYQDKTQNLKINLEAGWQTLDGEQAEQFARYRQDSYGDIGRVQRQQVLLKALQKKLYSPTLLARLPQAMHLIGQHLDTNLTVEEMLALANFGRSLQRKDVQMVMLPGRFSQAEEFDALSYWVIAEQGRDRVMQDYFDVLPPQPTSANPYPGRVRIAIQNASDDPHLPNRLVEYLAAQNYHNVYLIGEAPQLLRETEIVVQQGDLTAAEGLQSTLGLGRVEASSTGDLESDLTLRLGFDAKQLIVGDDFLKTTDDSVRPSL